MSTIIRKGILAGVLGVFAAACSACGPSDFYVREMKIDAKQHLTPVGPKSQDHPAADSFYMFTYTDTGLTTVDHLAKQPGSGNVRRLLYLEAVQSVLERTVKTDEVFTGPVGAVVAEKTCFYNRAAEYRSSVQVLVQSLKPDFEREVPDEVSREPLNVPPVTSFSVVQFLRRDSHLIFASGNYEANGTIGSMNSGEIANGEIQPGSSIGSPQAPKFDETRTAAGLPRQVEIGEYLRSRHISLLKTPDPPERTMVIVVYGFGALIRQDSLEDGVIISSRYLSPIMTEEDRVLGPPCDAQLREQVQNGEPTTF